MTREIPGGQGFQGKNSGVALSAESASTFVTVLEVDHGWTK